MLRGEAVIYRHHDTARLIGEAPTEAVMGVQGADDPAPSMDVDQERERPVPLRGVDADRDLPCWTGNRPIVDTGDGFGRALLRGLRHLRLNRPTDDVRRERIEGWRHRGHLVEVGSGLWVKRHGHRLLSAALALIRGRRAVMFSIPYTARGALSPVSRWGVGGRPAGPVTRLGTPAR